MIRFQLRYTRKSFLILLAGFFVLTAGWFGFLMIQQFHTDQTKQAQKEYREKEEMLSGMIRNYLQTTEGLEEQQEAEIRQEMEEQSSLLSEMQKARGEGDWRQELSLAIHQAQGELRLREMGVISTDTQPVEEALAWNRYLLEHDIKPKSPANACDGLHVLVMFGMQFLPLLVFICPLLFGLFQFQSERRNGGVKYLLQWPMARKRIVICKGIAALLQSLVLTVVTLGGNFLICTVFCGAGDVRYPVACAGGEFLSEGVYLARISLLLLSSLFLYAMLGILLSVLAEKEIFQVLGGMVLLGLPTIAGKIAEETAGWATVFSVDLSQVVLSQSVSVYLCSMVRGAVGILCLIAAAQRFQRADLVS